MPQLQQTLFPQLQQVAKDTLIIIGNGFDLAHDIKSSYWDFREWLFKNGNTKLVNMMDVFFSNERDVWSGIEQAFGEYDEEAILDYCRPDEEFDIEHSLSSSARVEDSPMAFFQPVLEEFKDAFEEWVDNIDINGIKNVYHLDPLCRYLTFNYTDTLETRYGIPINQIAHIHGSRQNNEEYVVGHNNPRNLSDAWDITNHKEFFNGLFGVKQIITYGHSMARVDWPYFAEIIKIVGVNVPWRVSCFSMNDRNNTAEFQKHFGLTNVTII